MEFVGGVARKVIMSFAKHGKGYLAHRTLYHIDRLYAWKHDLYFPPVTVEVNPTAICNQRCGYCYVAGRTKGKMDDALLLGVVGQLADAGVNGVVFQGSGEPLTHKALPDAIARASELGLAVSLTTNGVLLTPEIQDKILPHLTYVKISSVDSDPYRYANYHGCNVKQYESLIFNIQNMVRKRDEQGLNFLILVTTYLFPDNFREAYRIVKFLRGLGVDRVSVQEPVYSEYSYDGQKPMTSSLFPEEEIERVRQEVMSLCTEDFSVVFRFPLNSLSFINGRCKKTWVNQWCQGIKFNALIDTDGEVYLCFRYWGVREFSCGNVSKTSFSQIWKSERRKEMDAYTNITPPQGDECSICNVTKINEILRGIKDSDNYKWKDFLV